MATQANAREEKAIYSPNTRVKILAGSHRGKEGVVGRQAPNYRNEGKIEVLVGHQNKSVWCKPEWLKPYHEERPEPQAQFSKEPEIQQEFQPKPQEEAEPGTGTSAQDRELTPHAQPNPWESRAEFSITLLSGQNVEVKFIPGLEDPMPMHQFDLRGPVSPTGFQSHFVLGVEAEVFGSPADYAQNYAEIVAAQFEQGKQKAKGGKRSRSAQKAIAHLEPTIDLDNSSSSASSSSIAESETSISLALELEPLNFALEDVTPVVGMPEDNQQEMGFVGSVSRFVVDATEPEAIASVQADLTEPIGQTTKEANTLPSESPDSAVDLTSEPVELVVIQPTVFDYSSLDVETRIVIQQRTEQIKERLRRTAQDIVEIGEKLIEVKERLGHGKFGDWLIAEFDWDERTARRFMSVANVFKSDNLSDLSFAPSALYLLAAPSTPALARQQILDRAKQGEVITYAKAKKAVAEAKTKSQEASSVGADRSQEAMLRLGDWVEVHSLQGNQSWDGLRGPIVEPQDDDGRFGVDLSQASGQSEWKCLRFSMQELMKVPAPSPYKVGEIVMIKCEPDAEPQQRKHDCCWGIVREVLKFSVMVAVSGELVQYPPKDLDWVDAPSDTLKDVCLRVTRLWSVPNLPKSAQHLIRTFYQRELVFSQGDLDVLQAIEGLYQSQNLKI